MNIENRSQGLWVSAAIHIRWAILAGMILLTSDMLGNPVVIAALGLLAISNVALLLYVRSKFCNDEMAMKTASAFRFADGLIVIGLGFHPAFQGEKLWLLGVPVLIGEAMSSRTMMRVALLASVMIATQLAVDLTLHRSFNDIATSAGILFASAAVGMVLSGYRAKEERLSMRDKRLATVLDCGAAFAASRDLRSTMLHTLKAAVGETGASCGYVMLSEEDGRGPLISEAAFSAEGEFQFPITLDHGFGLSGYVAKMGQPIAVNDESNEHSEFDGVTVGVKSAISVPLVTQSSTSLARAGEEQVLGVMTLLCTRKNHLFGEEDMDLLRTLGSLIAVAVSNARLEEKQHNTFVRTLESLATALEARDEYTQGHSQRVCEVSLMLGDRMGFSPEAMEELRVGTVLHDIGKIGVPDAILSKPGRLTLEEFDVMKQHPVIGYEICKPLMLSDGVLMIIRNHHEKLDGSGYPDGLKGGELPLSLRIVCVADAFDAMSSSRPYRGVMAMSDVLAELSRGAGTQFDPVVVENLKELMRTDRMMDLYHRNLEEPEAQAA